MNLGSSFDITNTYIITKYILHFVENCCIRFNSTQEEICIIILHILLYIRGTGTNLEEDKFIGTKPTETLKKYSCQKPAWLQHQHNQLHNNVAIELIIKNVLLYNPI